MLLMEFLIYNLIIGIFIYISVKTRYFGISVLFAIMATLFIFKFMYADVTYSYELVRTNMTAYINSTNYTITNYGYNSLKTFTIAKGDTIFLYMAIVALLLVNVTMKLFQKRKKKIGGNIK